jgi:2'-5' RNA ligase
VLYDKSFWQFDYPELTVEGLVQNLFVIYTSFMPQQLSYSITSLAPDDVNEKFHTAKEYFNLLYPQPKTKPENFILKNLAHVTLKRLFYLKEGIRDEEVKSALTSIRFAPKRITAGKVELFRTQRHGNVLVVLVNMIPELQILHDELSALVDNASSSQDTEFEKKTFNPHLSILYNLPEERISKAKSYAEAKIIPITYELKSFLFMRDVPGVVGEREKLKEYFAK